MIRISSSSCRRLWFPYGTKARQQQLSSYIKTTSNRSTFNTTKTTTAAVAQYRCNTTLATASSSALSSPILFENNNPSIVGNHNNTNRYNYYYYRNFSVVGTNATRSTKPGLYTIEGLLQPNDFLKLAYDAMKESDNIRESISVWVSSKSDDDEQITYNEMVEILYQLDLISKTICNVIDASELCRSTHISEEWRNKAQETFTILQNYISQLNGDNVLYKSLQIITNPINSTIFNNELSKEEQIFTTLLKHEFEIDGIHLPIEQRQQVQQLQSHITNLETMFASNITTSIQNNTVSINKELIESMISRPVLQQHGAIYNNSTNNNDDDDSIQILTDSPIAHSILSYSNNSTLRKDIYMGRMTSCKENLAVLDNLIQVRNEAAKLLGYNSYSERFLQDKMITNSKDVLSFLNQCQQHIQPTYKQEMNILLNVKKQIEGGTTTEIEPWDIKYYISLIKSQQEQLQFDPSTLAPYLSLDNCLNALQIVVSKLFGIHMKEIELLNEERWDDINNTNSNEQIRKFIFIEENGDELGTMYLDLHPRIGKYTHAAHFTVRCGCVNDINGTTYQKPIIALVCNMNTGNASFSSHQEVETLFHEFGHALHSLLSRTRFQHLSGTRTAMDFVETPSHLLEQYIWDQQFLKILCKNSNGDNIPDSLIYSLQNSRNQFRCIEMQNQILLGLFDQYIFGNVIELNTNNKPIDIWSSLNQQYNIPYANGTHWFTNISHLITYGAGYYGYLYSQVFAYDIWKTLFTGDTTTTNVENNDIHCLSRTSGELLYKKLLIHGGSKNPNDILYDLLGGKQPNVKHYLDSITTTTSSSSNSK